MITQNDLALAHQVLWANNLVADVAGLDECQREIKAQMEACKNRYYVLECSRRLGKTFLLCVMAVEKALSAPKQQILYAAITVADTREFIRPIIEQICATAPFKVKYEKNANKFVFPNGSQIRLYGCDNKTKANRSRGANCHLALVDEAGFIPTLDYVLRSVIAPQTLTTRGRIFLASTPSDEPGHTFTTISEQAEQGGYHVRKTLYENPRITPQEIETYIADDAALMGYTVEEFKQTDVFKREYLALRVIDTNLSVIGADWDGVMEEVERPEFYDGYVAFDAGGVDPHGLLFGYWNFDKQELVIEDELLLRDNENTQEIIEHVKRKEAFLWGVDKWDGTLRALEKGVVIPTPSQKQPYLRVSDMGSPKLELRVDGVTFLPTPKHEKRAAIDAVRVMLRQHKIRIHPRCRNLARHIRTTMWLNERQESYRRTKNGEHGDLVDCLIYMVRNIRRNHNTRPDTWGVPSENVWVRPKPPGPDLLPEWKKFM